MCNNHFNILFFNQQLCVLCGEDKFSHHLLKCAGCSNSFHLFCLIPALNDMPKGKRILLIYTWDIMLISHAYLTFLGVWHCPRCVAYFVQSQPHPFTHEFGFQQAQRDYSLAEFGEMADQFKADYFRSSPHVNII